MKSYDKLNHTKWECKYHLVFIPKFRKKLIYGKLKEQLGPVLRELVCRSGAQLEEGHLMSDHVHMLISVPPKYRVSDVVGFVKGKSAIYVARNFMGRLKNYTGFSFWARGYFVTTVGRDEAVIREYIRNQEKEDERLEQLNLFKK